MSYIILPSRWTQQPQGPVVLAPEWARKGAVVFNPGAAGPIVNVQDGTFGTAFDATNASWGAGQFGRQLQFNGSQVANSTGWAGTYDPLGGASSVTVLAVFRAATFANERKLFGKWTTQLQFSIGTHSSNIHFYVASSSSAFSARRTNSLSLADNQWVSVAVSWPGGSTENLPIAVNGVLTTLGTNVFTIGTLTTLGTCSDFLGFGRLGGDSSTVAADIAFAVAIPNLYVPPGELKELSDNPWQIFRPIQRRIYVPSAGTGTNTYTYNGSGTVTLSGAATIARWRSYAGAGTVTLSGAAAVARWRSYAGAGTVTLSGAATTALVPAGTTTYTYSGAGTVTMSGAAAVARWRAWAGSGTVTLSGAATTAYTPGLVVYTYAGSGTITLSGAATTTGPLPTSRASGGAGKAKGKRARARILSDEQLTAEDRRRLGVPEPQEAAPEADQAPAPKRAKRAGKVSRGIQLAPEADLEAQRATEILAQRTAELMAQQQAAQEAVRAEGMAMLQAAAAIEADNELMMLLLMAA